MSDRKETVWFGKHKGLSVVQLVQTFPSYALWAHKNVRGFTLSPSEIQACVAGSDIGPGLHKFNPTWMEDDGGPDEYAGMSYSDFGNN